jgi:hypothetical protein
MLLRFWDGVTRLCVITIGLYKADLLEFASVLALLANPSRFCDLHTDTPYEQLSDPFSSYPPRTKAGMIRPLTGISSCACRQPAKLIGMQSGARSSNAHVYAMQAIELVLKAKEQGSTVFRLARSTCRLAEPDCTDTVDRLLNAEEAVRWLAEFYGAEALRVRLVSLLRMLHMTFRPYVHPCPQRR